VTVHVASINTRYATELCIRTMRRYAGRDFRLVVGDCGSTDGSLELLRDYEERGWLTLEVAPNGRQHAEWLDQWLRECPTRFAVFCDSDIEFFEPGWLDEMVCAAHDNDAALVCAEIIPSRARFVHPHSGAKRTLGARPAPWLLLVDAQRVRGRLDASFGYAEVEDPAAFGGIVGYDVGGAFFAGLRAVGFGWVQLPDSFRRTYRHFSGLSWRRVFDWRAPSRVRPGQLPRMATVYAHLLRARALRYGESTGFRST
jgi:glycosyltransferase involved in cell wall biosynthesis